MVDSLGEYSLIFSQFEADDVLIGEIYDRDNQKYVFRAQAQISEENELIIKRKMYEIILNDKKLVTYYEERCKNFPRFDPDYDPVYGY
jgi:hypothetical protein